MRQQVQFQGTSLQIAGVRGASGYCGYTSKETTGILSGVKSNMDLSPIMLIIIQ